MAGAGPFRTSAAPQEPAKTELPWCEECCVAELKEFASDYGEVHPCRERVVVAARQPLASIDQLNVDGIALINEMPLARGQGRKCTPE